MRKFDPWPVFFKREWNRNWPFLVDFAITGTLITKFSLGLTESLIQVDEPKKGEVSNVRWYGSLQNRALQVQGSYSLMPPAARTPYQLQK